MKKNTNAFTLVELLSVIVILAVLILIAVPTVSTIIENSKKNVFVADAKTIISSIKTNTTLDSTEENYKFFNVNDYIEQKDKYEGRVIAKFDENEKKYKYYILLHDIAWDRWITSYEQDYGVVGISEQNLDKSNVLDLNQKNMIYLKESLESNLQTILNENSKHFNLYFDDSEEKIIFYDSLDENGNVTLATKPLLKKDTTVYLGDRRISSATFNVINDTGNEIVLLEIGSYSRALPKASDIKNILQNRATDLKEYYGVDAVVRTFMLNDLYTLCDEKINLYDKYTGTEQVINIDAVNKFIKRNYDTIGINGLGSGAQYLYIATSSNDAYGYGYSNSYSIITNNETLTNYLEPIVGQMDNTKLLFVYILDSENRSKLQSDFWERNTLEEEGKGIQIYMGEGNEQEGE